MPQHFDELELSVLKSLGVGPNDPAAEAMLNRIAEVKDLQLGGDRAFQAGSQFFKTRFGLQSFNFLFTLELARLIGLCRIECVLGLQACLTV